MVHGMLALLGIVVRPIHCLIYQDYFVAIPFCFATIGSRFNHFHIKGESYTTTFLKIIIHKFYQVKFS
jgi:hypothetical protein